MTVLKAGRLKRGERRVDGAGGEEVGDRKRREKRGLEIMIAGRE